MMIVMMIVHRRTLPKLFGGTPWPLCYSSFCSLSEGLSLHFSYHFSFFLLHFVFFFFPDGLFLGKLVTIWCKYWQTSNQLRSWRPFAIYLSKTGCASLFQRYWVVVANLIWLCWCVRWLTIACWVIDVLLVVVVCVCVFFLGKIGWWWKSQKKKILDFFF